VKSPDSGRRGGGEWTRWSAAGRVRGVVDTRRALRSRRAYKGGGEEAREVEGVGEVTVGERASGRSRWSGGGGAAWGAVGQIGEGDR
jgi:hypothetical protein